MKIKEYCLLLLLIYSYIPGLAQVDTGWVRRYNGPGNANDYARALAVDDSGNVYVTGQSHGSGTSWDYATIKYSPTGDSLWVRRYNGPGNLIDEATDLAVDKNRNVYIAGESDDSLTIVDYTTIKYSATGDTLWLRRYKGPENGFAFAYALDIDDSGYVYVTGHAYSSATAFDYTTIKYSPAGDTLWVRGYNGPGNGNDLSLALVVDDSGNVYVTGQSIGTVYPDNDYATIKYSSAGEALWVRRYNGPGNGGDDGRALAVDDSGNVYVTGASTGIGTSIDYATIKYSSSGDTLWVRRYNGPENGNEYARALVVDGSGNVYVTGNSGTIKYLPNGDTAWVREYGISGFALAVDGSGNVYVTGSSGGDYATIKYAPNGDTLWVTRYNGPGHKSDWASALVVDASENVYVTGRSEASGTSYDYVTIKYNKYGCAARAGDANGDNNLDLSDILYKVNSIFKAGPTPDPFCAGDANADGKILLQDIIYLINFIYRSGPAPIKSKECCL